MIASIHIHNFKLFRSFDLPLNEDLNIIVGDNEAGKSTILEALSLALTKRLNGRLVEQELSCNLFNKNAVKDYVQAVSAGGSPELPAITIEVYFKEDSALEILRGSNNTKKTDSVGITLSIAFDPDFTEEYARFLEKRTEIKTIPTEYYKVAWTSFANAAITNRSLPVTVSNIDATTIRLQSGSDFFLQDVVNGSLDSKEKVSLSIAYRKLKEQFSNETSLQQVNQKLAAAQNKVSKKPLTISIDTSQRTSWETTLVPHLDDLPFQFIGKGEQSMLKILLALERKAKDSNIILIEEPENHLSFASMNVLINMIKDKCTGKQIIIATHSAYVLNKLGLDKVFFLHDAKQSNLSRLPADTRDYFKKLSGYDTLRLILAKKAILVEGPSDELVVQKAYLKKHGKFPIENGIDVINVRGLSFKRFLDIAQEINKPVVVVTDNDGDYQRNVVEKYAPYAGTSTIAICADSNDALNTLEPHFVEVNQLDTLNRVFGKTFRTKADMVAHMIQNKTEWALAVFESNEAITFPQYVANAI